MKIMIASDIHGSAYYCKQLMDALKKESADKLFLLGDILYHGPRNDLPRDYQPKSVISQLNEVRRKLLCVRGNCDTEVDQMVLNFPIMADYGILYTEGRMIYGTHGHIYHEENLPPLQEGDILLFGHTHVPKVEEHDHFLALNPGSVSIPKEGSANSYMTLTDGLFEWKTLEGSCYMKYELKEHKMHQRVTG